MSLHDQTIAYQVTIHRWGVKRQIPSGLLESLMPGERELVKKKMVSASKRIIESKEYDKIVSRDGYATRWLAEHSIPSILKKGVYCIPTTLCEEIDSYMEAYKSEREWRLVPAFLDVYAHQADMAREMLGEALFSSLEYPTEEAMRKLFSVETSYLTFDVPSSLKYVSEELFRREQERVQKVWEEAEREVQGLLIQECTELIGGLQKALKGLDDGTLKKFREANVNNLLDWASLFLEARNVTNNEELADVVRRIKAILQGVSPQALKLNIGSAREKVKGFMEVIQTDLKGMMIEQEERMIDLE